VYAKQIGGAFGLEIVEQRLLVILECSVRIYIEMGYVYGCVKFTRMLSMTLVSTHSADERLELSDHKFVPMAACKYMAEGGIYNLCPVICDMQGLVYPRISRSYDCDLRRVVAPALSLLLTRHFQPKYQYVNIRHGEVNKIRFKPRVLALRPRRSITCFLSHGSVICASTLGRASAV
jgi:hypothetical protein